MTVYQINHRYFAQISLLMMVQCINRRYWCSASFLTMTIIVLFLIENLKNYKITTVLLLR